MNQTRGFLYILLAVFTFLGFQAWVSDQAPKPDPAQATAFLAADTNAATDADYKLELKNDVLKLTVNSLNGDFIGADLLKYPRKVGETQVLNLLTTQKEGYLRVVNGLYGANGTDAAGKRAQYQVKDHTDNSVTLSYAVDGVEYLKRISLVPNSYQVKVDYTVTNNSGHPISLAPYAVFQHSPVPAPGLFSGTSEYGTNSSYAGMVTSTDRDNYDKVSYGDIADGDFKPLQTTKGWSALSLHFFVAAYIPDQNQPFNIYTSYEKNNQLYNINTTATLQTVENGTTKQFSDKYWLGPKLQDDLAKVAPDLNLVVDYGWAWFLASPMFTVLTWIQKLLGNWGLAIIGLTLVVRAVIFPLSRIQFRNQALMRVIQPEVALAQERAGDDRMKKLTEVQKVYQRYGASQFTGCFPALIQLPIFLSLFYLINEAVELRQQPFVGWIHDLSANDPYFILPIINGLLMVYMFSLTPMPDSMDPTQKKVMKAMPYMFMILFMFLPAGLILYYVVSNLVTIAFITYFNRKISTAYKNGTLKTYKPSTKASWIERAQEKQKELEKKQRSAREQQQRRIQNNKRK